MSSYYSTQGEYVMSELIQEEKQEFISYENFIPQWTSIIEEMDFKGIKTEAHTRELYFMERGFDYMDGKSCLVGEAHKGYGGYSESFNDDFCKDCQTLSYKSSFVGYTNGGVIFESFKHDLYYHMLEQHQEEMRIAS